jgi:hypothetical protein
MQLCNRMYYSKVYWRLNMFRAAHHSSSGTLNSTCSLRLIYCNKVKDFVYKPEAGKYSLELLMMSGVPLETCWGFNKLWNNKFYYIAASCWYFYCVIYDARIHEYQINPLNANLNPICHLLALLGAHHILHVSRIRVKTILILSFSSHLVPFVRISLLNSSFLYSLQFETSIQNSAEDLRVLKFPTFMHLLFFKTFTQVFYLFTFAKFFDWFFDPDIPPSFVASFCHLFRHY